MQQRSTLLPWLGNHKFMLATLASAALTFFGYTVRNFDEHGWLYVGIGVVGLVTFGVLTMVAEHKSKATLAVGVAGTTIGVILILFFAFLVLFLFALVMSLAGTH